MRNRVIGAVSAALIAAGALMVPASPANAAHYCTAATGTLVTIPLPDSARSALYIHDRAATTGTGLTGNPTTEDDTEGTWVFLENAKARGYNSGGVPIVTPLNATGSADTPCGAVADPDDPTGLTVKPKAGADDVIF